MKNQTLRVLLSIFSVLLFLFSFNGYAFIYSSFGDEVSRPNKTILEMQLNQNPVLVFGKVASVEIKKNSDSEGYNLKGFKFFTVNLEVSQVWSKNTIKKISQFYKIEFGTMTDEKDHNNLPVKLNEDLVVVLDEFKQGGGVHLLKDHLLNIYEHKIDAENENIHFFVSKLTKNYNEKNLELGDLYRIAYNEQMKVYENHKNLKSLDTKASRSIASTESSGSFVEINYASIKAGSLRDPSRDPNSVNIKNKEEELSVFSLLLIFIFLATFSHFIIKHYEKEEEF